jgi:hypothetical protein
MYSKQRHTNGNWTARATWKSPAMRMVERVITHCERCGEPVKNTDVHALGGLCTICTTEDALCDYRALRDFQGKGY